jgi:2-phosphosulfolactate phosphatase
MAVQDKDLVEYNILRSRSARRLIEIGFKKDVNFCLQRNISDNVAIFREHSLEKY